MASNIDALIAQGPRPVQVDPAGVASRILTLRGAMQGQQLQQEQIQAAQQENQMRSIQLDQTRALNSAYQAALTVDPTTGRPTIDRDQLTQALSKSGHGSAIPGILKSLDDLEKSHVDLQDAKNKVGVQEQDFAGSIGATTKAANYQPQVLKMAIADSVRRGHLPQQIAAPLLAQLDQADQQDPSGNASRTLSKQIADQLISQSPKFSELNNAQATANAAATRAGAAADEAQQKKDATWLNRAAGAQSQADLDGIRQTAKAAGVSDAAIAQIPGMYSPQAMTNFGKSLMTSEQRTQASQKDTEIAETAKRDQNTNRNEQARNAIAAGELAVRQKTFNATLGQGLDANGKPLSDDELKAIAMRDPVAVAISKYLAPDANTRTALGKATMDRVYALDKQHDGTQFAARNKTAIDYSPAGQTGKTFISIDNGLAHVDMLSQAGKALDNNDLPTLNRIANELGYQFGGSAKNVYDGIVQIVAPELIKGSLGEAGGEGERGGMRKTLTSDVNTATREQTLGAIATIFGKRIDRMRSAYKQTMNRDMPLQLSDDSKAVLQRYGGGGAAQLPDGGGKVLDPNNAKAFLQAAGGDKAKARQLAAQNHWKVQ